MTVSNGYSTYLPTTPASCRRPWLASRQRPRATVDTYRAVEDILDCFHNSGSFLAPGLRYGCGTKFEGTARGGHGGECASRIVGRDETELWPEPAGEADVGSNNPITSRCLNTVAQEQTNSARPQPASESMQFDGWRGASEGHRASSVASLRQPGRRVLGKEFGLLSCHRAK